MPQLPSNQRINRLLVVALVGFGATRALTIVVALVYNREEAVFELTNKGDATWYSGIAGNGYDHTMSRPLPEGGSLRFSSLAFFPLYPYLIRALAALGLSIGITGLIVTFFAGLVAAWGLFRLGECVRGPRVGVFLAILLGCLPGSVVLSMVLSEATFIALAVWALVWLLRDRILLSAIFCFFAGLTRPTALAVVAAVWWIAIPRLFRKGQSLRSLAASVLSVTGFLSYQVFVWLRLHRQATWFDVERTWNSNFDFGMNFLIELKQKLLIHQWVPYSIVAVLTIACVGLFISLFPLKVPPVLIVYSACAFVVVFGQTNYVPSRQRFVLGHFVLLLPIAIGLSKLRAWLGYGLLATAACASAYYGSWLLYDYPWSI